MTQLNAKSARRVDKLCRRRDRTVDPRERIRAERKIKQIFRQPLRYDVTLSELDVR